MKKVKVCVCGILPANWKAPEEFVTSFIYECLEQIASLGAEGIFILSIENSGREYWNILTEKIGDPRIVVNVYQTNQNGALLYLDAFGKALELGADLVLEIDCSQAHQANEIAKFIKDAVSTLEDDPETLLAVFSTRFSKGGVNAFPEKRKALSIAATAFAKRFLIGNQGLNLTDLTSGFEAFSGPLLSKIFNVLPKDKWVSVWWGPLHLFQTEARCLVIWTARHYMVSFYELPITFGANIKRKLAPLHPKYIIQAAIGGMLLVVEKLFYKP